MYNRFDGFSGMHIIHSFSNILDVEELFDLCWALVGPDTNIREVIIQKKKSCEFLQLWSCPPPLKVVKPQFFFTPWPQENHFVQNKKNSPLKTKKKILKIQY